MKFVPTAFPSAKWWRQFALVFLPLLAVMLLACFWLYWGERAAVLGQIASNSQVRLTSIQDEVTGIIDDSGIDALILATDADLSHLSESDDPDWSPFGEHLVQWLRNKPIYDHASVLDLQGRERLRVNLDSGNPAIVPKAELQSRSGYEPIEIGHSISRGTVYVSSLQLAVEQGHLASPARAIVRFATPTYDGNGVKRGILELDLIADRLLERIRELASEPAEVWLVDEDGQWLMGGLPEDAFSRQTHKGQLLKDRDADLFEVLSKPDNDHLLRGDGLWVFRPLRAVEIDAKPSLSRPHVALVSNIHNDHWHLVLHFDEGVLSGQLESARRTAYLAVAGAVILAAVIAALITTFMLQVAIRQEAEAAFFRLFEKVPLGVIVLTDAGEGLYFNQAWCNLSGITHQLSMGGGWTTCIKESDRQALFSAMQQVSSSGQEYELDITLHNVDGAARWVACRIYAVPADFGGQARFVIGVSDSQVHKEHEARVGGLLQLLEGVVSGCADPILVIDAHYCLSLINPAFGHMFGMLYGDVPAVGGNLADWMARWPIDCDALLGNFMRAIQGGTNHVRITLGPAKRLFDGIFSPLFRADGKVTGAVLFARDVTEIARMQARVARNEELFRAVFAGSLDTVFVLEAVRDRLGTVVDFRFVEVSGPAVAEASRGREDFVGKLMSERHPIVTRELGYFERARQVMETGEPFVEERFIEGDGVPTAWYEIRLVSLGWGVTLTSRNISSRKQAELALESAEALQRNILDSSPYSIVAVDRDGLITVFNKAAEQLLGYDARELVGRYSTLLFHDTREVARCAIELSAQYGLTIEPGIEVFETMARHQLTEAREWTYITKSKRRVPVLLSISPRRRNDGEIVGNMGIAYDISRQKEAEAERDRLYAVVEAIPDMVGMADLHGNMIYLNQAGRQLCGVGPDEPLDDLHASDAWTEWSYQLIHKVGMPQALAGKPWTGDTQLRTGDGRVLDVRQLLVAPRMGGREPTFSATVVHDLSEVRAMENKMVEEDALLNSVLESVQDAIVVLDGNGLVQSLNPAVAEVFQYGLHEVISKDIAMLLTPETASQLHEDLASAKDRGARRFTDIRREGLGKHKNGSVFPMEMSVSEIMFVDHRIYTMVMRDISERKEAEARLLRNIEELQKTQEALASANTQLQEFNSELNRMVQIDGLTGVANRRAFDNTLVSEWSRAARSNKPISLLMIDVDHFKLYNDGYGHQMGDECLKRVAGILQDSVVRTTDFVARYGGEEFVAVLPDTDRDGVTEVAERIRRGLADARIPHAFSKTASYVTVSIGAATMMALNGVSPSVLISAADVALYRSKDSGRDRLTHAG